MNYNSNTFVISTGEHLASIAYAAPWLNGQPINHGQAYLLLSAVHEEVFNELFAWANIDNSVQQALGLVYAGCSLLEPSPPKLWMQRAGNWVRVDQVPVNCQVMHLPPRTALPRHSTPGVVYQVAGGQQYAEWLVGFVNVTLHNVAARLRAELNHYLGSMRDYEWWFEYNGNGILYSRQNKATINYVNPVDLVTEEDHVNFETCLLPKIQGKAQPLHALIINAIPHECEGPQAEAHLNDLISKIPGMLTQYYTLLSQANRREGEILIKYRSVMVLQYVEEAIKRVIPALPVQFKIVSEKQQDHVISMQTAYEKLDRNLQQRSIDTVNQQHEQLIKELLDVRNRIVKRNQVSELDLRALEQLAPSLLKQTHPQDTLCNPIGVNDWHKFNNKNPMKLSNPVIMLSIMISDHVDWLTGNAAGSRNIPVYRDPKDETPLSVIALYPNQ